MWKSGHLDDESSAGASGFVERSDVIERQEREVHKACRWKLTRVNRAIPGYR
jgi:hypothetical protein